MLRGVVWTRFNLPGDGQECWGGRPCETQEWAEDIAVGGQAAGVVPCSRRLERNKLEMGWQTETTVAQRLPTRKPDPQ